MARNKPIPAALMERSELTSDYETGAPIILRNGQRATWRDCPGTVTSGRTFIVDSPPRYGCGSLRVSRETSIP